MEQTGITKNTCKKKEAYNPYLPSWEYIPDGEPYVLMEGYIYLVRMTDLTGMYSALEIMYAGRHQ